MALDATDPDALAQIGVSDFDVVVVAIGANMQASILATSQLAELGARQIVAKALTDAHARILSRVGAHRVVFPEHEMGVRLANALAGTNLIDFIELDPAYSIAEVHAPASVAGKSLREADIRGRFGVIVLCVKSGPEIDVIPDAGRESSSPSDVLVHGGADGGDGDRWPADGLRGAARDRPDPRRRPRLGPVAALLRLPLMVVLVGTGVLVGPSALDVAENPLDGVGAQLVFTLGVSLILFHGGVGISLRIIERTAVGLGLLVLPGVALTAAVVSVPVHYGARRVLVDRADDRGRPGLDRPGDPDPAVRAPAPAAQGGADRHRGVGLQRPDGHGADADPRLRRHRGLASTSAAPTGDFAQSLLLGAAIGIGGGVGLAVLLSDTASACGASRRRRRSWPSSPRSTSPARRSAASGYLAAFVMGLVVGNMDLLGLPRHREHFARARGVHRAGRRGGDPGGVRHARA